MQLPLRLKTVRRPGGWGTGLILILGVWVAIASVWFIGGWGDPVVRTWAANGGNLVISLSATVLAWRASRHPDLAAGLRRPWRIVALAFLLTSVGDGIWMYLESALQADAFPSMADVVYMAYYPVMFMGLLAFPGRVRSRDERLQAGLDLAITLLGGWIVIWHLVIGPIAYAAGASVMETAISLAYPLGDLALFSAATFVLFRRWDEERNHALILLVCGNVLYVIAEVVWAYSELQDAYVSGNITEPLWPIAAFIMALAAHTQYVEAGRKGVTRPPLWPVRWLPYTAIGVAYGILLTVSHKHAPTIVNTLLYGAVGVTALVVLRQLVTINQNVRLAAENVERRNEARFSSLVRNSSDVITIVDAGLTILYQSPSVERIFGHVPGELTGTSLSRLVPPDRVLTLAALLEAGRQVVGNRPLELQWLHRDGSLRHVEITVTNLLDDPTVGGLVLNTRDITERKELEEQIRHQAFYDPVTGLGNRALLKERLERILQGPGGRQGRAQILFLDLDNFKTVNDSLGHSVGDQVLESVARRLLACAGSAEAVVRLGGDEFAILLTGADAQAAVSLADVVMTQFQEPYILDGREVRIGVSIGIAGCQAGAERMEELLRNADLAMYVAKGKGKGCCEVFHQEMFTEARTRLELEADLGRAIVDGQMVLHYQPIVSLDSGRTTAVEALVRWRHPTRGMLSPATFIPLAEECGMIVPLGRWVLSEACFQLRSWQSLYPQQAPSRVSVNLSVEQLNSPHLVEQVREALDQAGLAPGCLVLEVTESRLLNCGDGVLQRLNALRTLGVRISIDDFGTGYSSLSYLRWLPVDVLKLDKSFLEDIDQNPRVEALVSGLVAIASALNVSAVAEGVERPEQAALLQQLGCGFGQGYHFGRPVPPEEILAGLTRSRQAS